MPPQEPNRHQLGTYFALAQVGLEMVIPIGLGWWVDERMGSGPWLLVLGVVLGFVLGIVHLVVFARRDDPKPPGKKEP
ncbi:MAG TPA: AtpZ/AtpI family protein [Gemmataceae bacterium]|jgi:F0F1-type ATP synthase assembly protein I|nr:AtpZ/AtpI family protein [Gemmataceae bacterium]